MDKIQLLQKRKEILQQNGKKIREQINTLIDENSFVELSTFSFSKNQFYDEESRGEGVVTGFATINDYPFYIVAQNSEVLSGGVSKANCNKVAKCIEQAEKNETPIIYLISTMGVQIGEGVNVLEGLASLLLKATQLKGTIPQYLIVNGELYGQLALLSALCDFTFFVKNQSIIAPNSPAVISAEKGAQVDKNKVGGYNALTNTSIMAIEVEDLLEVKLNILKISQIIYNDVIDNNNLNDSIPALNETVDYDTLLTIFDEQSTIEVGTQCASEVKCLLGRVGGISLAAVVFEDGDGVYLNANNVRKIKDFAEYACCYGLPFVVFVNTLGLQPSMSVNNSVVLKEIGELISILDCMDTAKISLVYGKAIGLGYTLFAAKSMGYDYSYAFANAKIALFDSIQGAEIEFNGDKTNMDELARRYSDENSDPINAAKDGYIDNIIEPAFVKQYLIASLQMLLK